MADKRGGSPYPESWQGHWFDEGRPSHQAVVNAWGVLLKSIENSEGTKRRGNQTNIERTMAEQL